jgi:hypothetical protein
LPYVGLRGLQKDLLVLLIDPIPPNNHAKLHNGEGIVFLVVIFFKADIYLIDHFVYPLQLAIQLLKSRTVCPPLCVVELDQLN